MLSYYQSPEIQQFVQIQHVVERLNMYLLIMICHNNWHRKVELWSSYFLEIIIFKTIHPSEIYIYPVYMADKMISMYLNWILCWFEDCVLICRHAERSQLFLKWSSRCMAGHTWSDRPCSFIPCLSNLARLCSVSPRRLRNK